MVGRVLGHPAAWAVPLLVVAAVAVLPLNDAYYETVVNYDPQGDEQLYEWRRTTAIFRQTTGLLLGQLIALLAGELLARRHRLPVALAVAALLGAALAATAFTVGRVVGSEPPLDDPVFVRMVARELAMYPLYACAGVGLGALLRHWPRARAAVLVMVVVPTWCVATLIGLSQHDHWLYWVVPPIGAARAVALLDAPAVAWGGRAVVGVASYAIALNLIAMVIARRRLTCRKS